MIKNIIFDMGGVLLRFDRDFFLERIDVPPEDRALLKREVYLSTEWAMMDRGSIAEAEAARRMCQRVPERLHKAVHLLVDEWERPILPIPGMAELIKELKEKGYGIYLLSNASLRQHVYWPEIPGSEFFDGTVISSDIGLVKPQPEIYLYTLNKFGLKGMESVFIDDSNANIEGAIYSGLNGLVFFDTPRLRNDLKTLGVDL